MKEVTIKLTDADAKYIAKEVESGYYRNLDEAMKIGVKLLRAKKKAAIKELLDAVELGEQDFREGRYTTIRNREEHEAFFKRIIEEARRMRAQMKSQTVSIRSEDAHYMASRIKVGRYISIDEMISKGLALLQAKESAPLKEVQHAIDLGEKDIREHIRELGRSVSKESAK